MPRVNLKSRTPLMLSALSIWTTETRWSKWCLRDHTKKIFQSGIYRKPVKEICFPGLPDRRKMSTIWTFLSTWESRREESKGHQRLQVDSILSEHSWILLNQALREKDLMLCPPPTQFLEWERLALQKWRGLKGIWLRCRRNGTQTTSFLHSSELAHQTTRIPIWNRSWIIVIHPEVRKKLWPSKGILILLPGCITELILKTSPMI